MLVSLLLDQYARLMDHGRSILDRGTRLVFGWRERKPYLIGGAKR